MSRPSPGPDRDGSTVGDRRRTDGTRNTDNTDNTDETNETNETNESTRPKK